MQPSQNNCNYWRKILARLHLSKELWPSPLIISLWRLLLTVPRAYSERSRTSKMELSEKKFSAVYYFSDSLFTQKLHLRCSTQFWIRLWNCNYFSKRHHLDVWLGSRYRPSSYSFTLRGHSVSKRGNFKAAWSNLI